MDYVGNAHHGVVLPYNYWPRRRWHDAFRDLGLTVRAWRLAAGRAIPLTSAQAFALACTDPATGDPVPPEPGARYEDAFPLDHQAP